MAANPVVQQKVEPVTFKCVRWPNLKIRMVASQAIAAWEGQRQVIHETPERFIVFKNGLYKTSDPTEINFIRNHPNYTGRTATGAPERRCIGEVQAPDPRQLELYRQINTLGLDTVLQAVNKQYGVNPEAKVQDPVLATLQQQQGQPTNGNSVQ